MIEDYLNPDTPINHMEEEITKILEDNIVFPEDKGFATEYAVKELMALIIRVTDELLRFQSPAEEHHERRELRNELRIKRDTLLGKKV